MEPDTQYKEIKERLVTAVSDVWDALDPELPVAGIEYARLLENASRLFGTRRMEPIIHRILEECGMEYKAVVSEEDKDEVCSNGRLDYDFVRKRADHYRHTVQARLPTSMD